MKTLNEVKLTEKVVLDSDMSNYVPYSRPSADELVVNIDNTNKYACTTIKGLSAASFIGTQSNCKHARLKLDSDPSIVSSATSTVGYSADIRPGVIVSQFINKNAQKSTVSAFLPNTAGTFVLNTTLSSVFADLDINALKAIAAKLKPYMS